MYIYMFIYIYIYIYIDTMIYRYTEKIQKAKDYGRISRLKRFPDVQRADGAQSSREGQTAESSTKCPIGNTLIHTTFISMS